MKATVLKNNLKDGLGKVERAVTQKDGLLILRNVLLKTNDGGVTVSTTNLEMGVTTTVPGKISDNGGITVPFQTLFDIILNTDSEKINLETSGATLHLKTDNYEAKIQGTKPEDFPIIPTIENKAYIEIDGGIFKESLSSIISAAQISEIRPEISGILFDFQITILKLVATDSFRLAEETISEREFKTTIPRGLKAIIPLETMREVLRLIPDKDRVSIFFDPHQVLFTTGPVTLVSRLIDGNYPDYEQIIPKAIETELEVQKDQLAQGIKLVSSFSGKSGDIKLRLKDGKKVLEIYSANPALGENTYLVPVKCTKGDAFKDVAFNWRYVMDGLKALRGKEIIFGVNGETKPALLKSPHDNSYFYIVMPIRL